MRGWAAEVGRRITEIRVVGGLAEGEQGQNIAKRIDGSELEERDRAPKVIFLGLSRRAHEDDDEWCRGSLPTQSSLRSERDASDESQVIHPSEVDDLAPAHPDVEAANDKEWKAETQGSHRTWSTAVEGDSWEDGSDSGDEERLTTVCLNV